MPCRSALLSFTAIATLSLTVHAAPNTNEMPIQFQSQAGDSVSAYEGTLMVPENRAAPDSRMITLKYVRFPATGDTDGAPIVYLAGGPGGSGIQTAKYDRFPLFMAMREFGDVIAYDQRGTGASNDLPNCTSSHHISVTEKTSDAAYFQAQQDAFRECLTFWEASGIDVRGYTTRENANDLSDLREHLGVDKISLWGSKKNRLKSLSNYWCFK